MTLAEVLTLFAIGFVGSYISGMVGIGGSIIKYPLLLYIPPLLGVASYSSQEVAADDDCRSHISNQRGMNKSIPAVCPRSRQCSEENLNGTYGSHFL